ncbi:hypothetical protein [Microvirga zambiensis]|uniref:hypothetical protein n=1 Tax=Microvirga zambiensis TaxID=1402137 RepID=UPI0019200ADB|nr:hypothetical protein [Microvirga zambiensis]
MNTDRLNKARLAADEVFERGSRPEDIRAALAELADEKRAFLDRLAVRASLQAASECEAEDAPPASILDSLMTSYDTARAQARSIDLATPAPWLAAKAAFGNDMPFIMKLAGRQITTPTRGFLRYAADALGVAIERLQEHFIVSGGPALAGVERKASGKQSGPTVESFEAAIRASKLPEDLKNRWLSE